MVTMNRSQFTKLMADPKSVSKEHTLLLESVVSEFPFFQTAKILHLKGLKKQNSFQYNQALKKCAAHTTDRTILFDFIVQNPVQKPISNTKTIEEGTPLEFDKDEQHSFLEWLTIATPKPIERSNEKSPQKIISNNDLIDKFIENNPKITIKPVMGKNIDLAKNQKIDPQELMTETLARVYWEQKKYKKAIQAFKILSLKYPEKSGFFADQIKKLKKAQASKNN
jgi:hypothetical protein